MKKECGKKKISSQAQIVYTYNDMANCDFSELESHSGSNSNSIANTEREQKLIECSQLALIEENVATKTTTPRI